MTKKLQLTDDEWRRRLDPLAYHVTREKGTERPFTSPLLHVKEAGKFTCIGCGAELFRTETKYESGCGWPSFTQPAQAHAITTVPDTSHGMTRTEVLCATCDAHLGHVFDDGPAPTGLRYCMNGAALRFDKV